MEYSGGWSQACLAHLEGGATWADSTLFKEERIRLSWCRGKSVPDLKIPCPAFNTDSCSERKEHAGEDRIWVHQCGVCFYGLHGDPDKRYTKHSAHGCRKKAGLKLVTEEGRFENRKRQQNHNQKRDEKPDRPK